MRIFKGTVIVGTLLLLALAVQPVMAACGNAAILGSAAADRKSYVWTEGGSLRQLLRRSVRRGLGPGGRDRRLHRE